MKCDHGRLQAYLDRALPAAENAALEEHLHSCTPCQERLAHLRQQGTGVAERLRALDPQVEAAPQAGPALARFWKRARPALAPATRTPQRRRWRWAMAALATLAVVGVLFSFAPVRLVAAQFLGIFRVQKFAVITVDPARLEQLAGLQDLAMAALGEPAVLRQPGTPQDVADAAGATALAGFRVRVPADLPAGAVLQAFRVTTGPALRFEVQREQAQALLLAAGVEDVALPDVATLAATVDIASVVDQEYRIAGQHVSFVQSPSPAVDVPAAVDPAQLGQALFRFLGVPAEDAERLARQIDWTSTLVIPLPSNVAQFREVEVDGVTGLLLEPVGSTRGGAVLWQRDGIVYAVVGEGLDPAVLLQIAGSLK